jgi:hypothetical protein
MGSASLRCMWRGLPMIDLDNHAVHVTAAVAGEP